MRFKYHFTQKTLPNGQPAYEYYPDDVAVYMSSCRPGYTVSYGDIPNASDIQAVLDMSGQVGVSYNGHNYIVKEVNWSNGDVRLYDPTNPENGRVWVKDTALTGVYNFYKN